MAVDVEQDGAGAPPAHGRGDAAAEGKGKGSKLPKWFTGPHRDMIMVIGTVALVGIGVATLRRPRAEMVDGTSAAQAAYLGNHGSVAGFDQAAVQGLQDNLNQQRDANAGAFDGLQDLIAKQQAVIDGLVTSVNTIPSKIKFPTPAAPAPAPAPAPGAAPGAAPAAGSGPQYVTVRRGDTLSHIAARYRENWITPQSIGSLNGLRNINLIFPGQKLRVY